MRRWRSAFVAAIGIVLTTMSPSGAVPIPASMTWDLAKDFRTAPSQANPSPDRCGNKGVWSYLAGPSNDPDAYRQLPDFATGKFHVQSLETWSGEHQSSDEADTLPAVGLNVTPDAVDIYNIHWPAGDVLVHPLPSDAAVVAWRSPITGTVTIFGQAWLAQHPDCGNGVEWSLRDGATVLRSGAIAGHEKARWTVPRLHVTKGDQIYLAIDARDDYHSCDSTIVRLIIKKSKGSM